MYDKARPDRQASRSHASAAYHTAAFVPNALYKPVSKVVLSLTTCGLQHQAVLAYVTAQGKPISRSYSDAIQAVAMYPA